MDTYQEHLVASIAIAQDCRSTNIQTKAGSRRKRRSNEASTDVPWSASRCNRLLRTISSRISILQKLASTGKGKKCHSKQAYDASKVSEPVGESEGKCSPPTQYSNLGTSPSKDPEWLPQAKAQHKPATYAGKAKIKKSPTSRKSHPSTADPEFGFPTPFVKRMLRTRSSSSSSDSESHRGETLRVAKRKHLLLPVKPASYVEEAHRNLVAALDSLLRATESHVPRTNIGTSSLMRTCLRKVPQYITLEEDDTDSEDDEDDSDLSFEIYSELESLSTKQISGWAGLREVVRTHGILKISNAIGQGLIPEAVICALVDVCSKAHAVGEGQTLLVAWTKMARCNIVQALSSHLNFSQKHGTQAGFVRSETVLLDDGLLSAHDIDYMQSFWRELVGLLVRPETQAAGVNFLVAYLNACSRNFPVLQPSQASKTLATMLTAMALSGHEDESPSQTIGGTLVSVIHLVATNLGLLSSSSKMDTVGSLFLNSSLILQACSLHADPDLVGLNLKRLVDIIRVSHTSRPKNIPRSSRTVTGAEDICEISNCVRKLDVEAGNELFERMIRNIVQASAMLPRSTSAFMKTLALDSAVAYADQHNTKDTLAFVEEVEEMTLHGAAPSSMKTPGRRPNPKLDQYQWEEGLCEWIAITPLAATSARSDGAVSEVMSGETVSRKELKQNPRLNDGWYTSSKGVAHKRKSDTARLQTKRSKVAKVSGMKDVGQENMRAEEPEDLDELALFASATKPIVTLQRIAWDAKYSSSPFCDMDQIVPGRAPSSRLEVSRSRSDFGECLDPFETDDELGM